MESTSPHAVKMPEESRSNTTKIGPQILASISASYLCISAGNVLGYTSTAIPSMLNSTLPQLSSLRDTDSSWIGSLAPLGGLAGSLVAVFFIKYFGTRKTILFFALPLFLLSWLSIGAFESLPMIYFGRALGGLASGITISTCPVYVTDVASSTWRGTLGVIPSLFLGIGILTSYVLGVWLDWQYLALACGFIVIPAFVLLLMAPETPSWLLKNDRVEESVQVLDRLGRLYEEDSVSNGNGTLPEPGHEEIDLDSENEGRNDTSITIRNASILDYLDRPFLIAVGIMSLQQFVGINYVTFYGVRVFKDAIPDMDPNIPCIVFAVTQVVGTLVSISIIESYGRKSLLLTSATLVGLMTATLSINFYLTSTTAIEHVPLIPVIALSLYIFFFCLGFGAVTWILVVEILHPARKHVQNPVLISWMWFCSFLVTYLFPILEGYTGLWGVFVIFTGVAWFGVGFITLFVPETKKLDN